MLNVDISYTEFYPNRKKNVENCGNISFKQLNRQGAKGAVCGLRSAHFAGECALLKPEKCHLFLPSPMHACPRHGPRATSSDG